MVLCLVAQGVSRGSGGSADPTTPINHLSHAVFVNMDLCLRPETPLGSSRACLLTASSLPPHCLLTASSLPPHCLLTASSLPPHCLLTASSPILNLSDNEIQQKHSDVSFFLQIEVFFF